MTNTAVVLERAAELIERGHCKGALARDVKGERVFVASPNAAKWCLWGSVECVVRQGPPIPYNLLDDIESLLARVIGGHTLAAWNDAPERTAAEVVAALRQAARLARQWEEA